MEKIKILIAEDEKIISLDLKRILERTGYTVVSIVNNGVDAIIKAEEKKPDLILMDIKLDGAINGIEASKIILEKLNVPIVFLTALTDNETLQNAKLSGTSGYLLKPYDERSLYSTIEMALYKFKVDMELKKKSEELEEEKLKGEKLLYNVMPKEIVQELKKNGFINPRYYKSSTILFTDFHRFSNVSSKLKPDELIDELNDIFQHFDTIIENYGLEKLKTVGDTYMICGGVPRECDDHAVKVVKAALDLRNYVLKRNKSGNHGKKYELKMRAGINSGNVVAGVVGRNKFSFDVWGDTVNIASRIENICEPGKINISGNTYKLIKDYFTCSYQGKFNANGNGEIDVYSVEAIKYFENGKLENRKWKKHQPLKLQANI